MGSIPDEIWERIFQESCEITQLIFMCIFGLSTKSPIECAGQIANPFTVGPFLVIMSFCIVIGKKKKICLWCPRTPAYFYFCDSDYHYGYGKVNITYFHYIIDILEIVLFRIYIYIFFESRLASWQKHKKTTKIKKTTAKM